MRKAGQHVRRREKDELWAGAINSQADSIVEKMVQNVNKKILIFTNKSEITEIRLPVVGFPGSSGLCVPSDEKRRFLKDEWVS